MQIEIVPGTEHGVKSIRLEKREDLFYGAFLQAAGALTEIINTSNMEGRDPDFYGYPNNLITFCGGRGQGKTSAMLSFSRALEDNRDFGGLEGGRFNAIRETQFLVMPAIDPTVLEDWQNILTVILSRLFVTVKNYWDKGRGNFPHQGDDRDRRDLIEAFQRCVNGVDAVKGPKKELPFDSLEQLEQLGDSSHLKRYFHDLILSVLKLVGGETEAKNRYLIIQLDDTDLQFQQAYAVLEDIRKYLAIPNVVILMATDMEQLRKLVVQHYSNYFSPNRGDPLENSKLQDMANKYLDKLIPSRRTIYLPQFEERCWTDTGLTLSYGTHIVKQPFQEGILKYIRKKTGIIFLKPSAYLHNIIPGTFRGLVHLLNFLAAMEDIPETVLPEGLSGSYLKAPPSGAAEPAEMFERAAQTARRNLKLFENYFLYEWCVDKLSVSDYEWIQTAERAAPNQKIKRLLEAVCNRNGESLDALPERTDYLKLVGVLKLGQESAGESDYRFYFAVHTYLTIQLHKLMWRCRSETLDQNRRALAEGTPVAEVFDYEKLRERLGTGLFRYDQADSGPDFTHYEFTVDRDIIGPVFRKDSGTGGLLIREDGTGMSFSAGQIFLGMLCPYGTISQGVQDFYFAQECCLDILLNWDVQDKIYKDERFFRNLPAGQGTNAELGQRGTLFAGRYTRLLEFLSEGVDVLSPRCRAAFDGFLKSQRLQSLWSAALVASDGFLKREAELVICSLQEAVEKAKKEDLLADIGDLQTSSDLFRNGYSIYKGYLLSDSELPQKVHCAGELWKLMLDATEGYIAKMTGRNPGDKWTPTEYIPEFEDCYLEIYGSGWGSDLFGQYISLLEVALAKNGEPDSQK